MNVPPEIEAVIRNQQAIALRAAAQWQTNKPIPREAYDWYMAQAGGIEGVLVALGLNPNRMLPQKDYHERYQSIQTESHNCS